MESNLRNFFGSSSRAASRDIHSKFDAIRKGEIKKGDYESMQVYLDE